MNIFVETNGPYVYRSIFRKIPRLRHEPQQQEQPVHGEHAGTDRCHACGAPIDIQGYSAYTTPAKPEFEFEPELQSHPNPNTEPQPEPQPEPGLGPETEPQPEPTSTSTSEPDSESEPEPQPPAAESDQQQPELQHQQQYTAEAIAELDAKTFVPVARVLEIFQFLFKTVDDALIRQPLLLSRISNSFAEGLAALAGPGPQP